MIVSEIAHLSRTEKDNRCHRKENSAGEFLIPRGIRTIHDHLNYYENGHGTTNISKDGRLKGN